MSLQDKFLIDKDNVQKLADSARELLGTEGLLTWDQIQDALLPPSNTILTTYTTSATSATPPISLDQTASIMHMGGYSANANSRVYIWEKSWGLMYQDDNGYYYLPCLTFGPYNSGSYAWNYAGVSGFNPHDVTAWQSPYSSSYNMYYWMFRWSPQNSLTLHYLSTLPTNWKEKVSSATQITTFANTYSKTVWGVKD